MMSDPNKISSIYANGKVVIEFASQPPPPPPTPAKDSVDSSAPRQSAPVSAQELAYQLDVMANVAKQVFECQQQQSVQRRQVHEIFLARVLTDLEGMEKRVDAMEENK